MLWNHYVYRQGDNVDDLWDQMYRSTSIRLLYIAGGGFDDRVRIVLKRFIDHLGDGGIEIDSAQLVIVKFTNFELGTELSKRTDKNIQYLKNEFSKFGDVVEKTVGREPSNKDETGSEILKTGIDSIVSLIVDQTDIIMDVSSLPRAVYLSLMMRILAKLVPDKSKDVPLFANGVNFQILVAEDAELDSKIVSEDPETELLYIPGFHSSTMEGDSELPIVWFPILGENKEGQFRKVLESYEVPSEAEICPVFPHPSRDPRRGERLAETYFESLFKSARAVTSNILYAHENHPFEAYRQMYLAMKHYVEGLKLLKGCRIVVTPLASKLLTIGAGLACFDMKPGSYDENYRLTIPCVSVRRYIAKGDDIEKAKPEIAALLLTGRGYAIS